MNLIRFHEGVEDFSKHPNMPVFKPSNEKAMEFIRDYLTDHGITTTIRRSRGEDILAACGMLVNSLTSER
jgi:23S rRNA (adenine2503-C2)-methyltransferase